MRRFLAGMALAAGVFVALPNPAAYALPATSGDVGEVLEPAPRPTVTRTPTGPVPVPTAPSMVRGFTVTTDSVIGTATVRYGEAGSLVTVRWGDGTRSVYDPFSPLPMNGGSAVSPDTVVFKHEYPAGLPATYIATVTVEKGGRTDLDSRQVIVTPRYLVSQYQAFFAPSHCDSAVEEYTEWSISQKLNGSTLRTWRMDIKTNTFPGAEVGGGLRDFRALDGSLLAREMTMADGPLTVSYTVTEIDPVFDDDAGTKSADLHPGIAPANVVLEYSGDDCRAQVKFDTDVRLLRPAAGLGGGIGGGGVLSTSP
jgi:hypothetical protein